MKEKLKKLKEKKSLYEISLDIGVSNSSLYNYLNDYKELSKPIKDKIEKYLERV